VSAAAQARADFSGTWNVDTAKSDPGRTVSKLLS